LSSNSEESKNGKKNITKKSYRSRDESSISCMQDIENMINENNEKKSNKKLKRFKIFSKS
jgi:hypothetical protein